MKIEVRWRQVGLKIVIAAPVYYITSRNTTLQNIHPLEPFHLEPPPPLEPSQFDTSLKGRTSVRLGEVEKSRFRGWGRGGNLDFSTSPNLIEVPPFPLEVKAKG